DERAPRHVPGRAAGRLLDAGLQVAAGHLERGCKADREPDDRRREEGKGVHGAVQADGARARKVGGAQCHQCPHAQLCHHDAERARTLSKLLGITPRMVYGVSLSVTSRPTTALSAPSRRRQSASLMTTTFAPLGRSSAASKPRPTAGCTPSTRK